MKRHQVLVPVLIGLWMVPVLWLVWAERLSARQEGAPLHPAQLSLWRAATNLTSGAPTGTVAIYLPLLDHGVFTVLPEQIAFETTRDGNYEIYSMNPDGSQPANLTRHPGEDGGPAWSPEGRRLAFSSSRSGNSEIYVMDRDGTDQVRLTDHPGRDIWPTWSPNGTRIAFMSDRDSVDPDTPKYDIYVMNADGSDQTRITFDEANDRWPAWSPDGTTIAFTSNRDSALRKIWIMDPNGSNLHTVSEQNVGYDDFYPTWSPDGRITFVSNRPAPGDGSRDDEIYIMDADGWNVQQLTNNDAGDWLAHWSPDGTRFAFYTNRDRNKNIYVKTFSTGEEMRITDNPSSEEYPAWSP